MGSSFVRLTSATPEAFSRDPKLVWEFYNWRRELIAPLSPNPGHFALMDNREPNSALYTYNAKNIDGLHQKAGSRNIVELHGNLWKVRCTGCKTVIEDRRIPLPELPACESCGSLLRPHVVWFGEMLDSLVLDSAYEAIADCDLMMVIGTSGTVQPAALMGVQAKRNGAAVAEINLEPTPYSDLIISRFRANRERYCLSLAPLEAKKQGQSFLFPSPLFVHLPGSCVSALCCGKRNAPESEFKRLMQIPVQPPQCSCLY